MNMIVGGWLVTVCLYYRRMMNTKESLAFRFSPPFYNPPEPCSPPPTATPSEVTTQGREEEGEGVKKTSS